MSTENSEMNSEGQEFEASQNTFDHTAEFRVSYVAINTDGIESNGESEGTNTKKIGIDPSFGLTRFKVITWGWQ